VIRTVDLVIAGGGNAALSAATDALQHGLRILIVLGGDARVGQQIRRGLWNGRNANDPQVTVITKAAVVCVDGVDGVEAVVIRYTRTGRLCAVNTSAFLSCDSPVKWARAGRQLA
jgi:thioredoxin reductase